MKLILGNTSSKYYGLTLMICLMKHLADIEVRDSLPVPKDKSDGADLSRLKFYRNQILCSENVSLSSETFNTLWREISKVNT